MREGKEQGDGDKQQPSVNVTDEVSQCLFCVTLLSNCTLIGIDKNQEGEMSTALTRKDDSVSTGYLARSIFFLVNIVSKAESILNDMLSSIGVVISSSRFVKSSY